MCCDVLLRRVSYSAGFSPVVGNGGHAEDKSGQVDRQGSGMCMVNVPFDWMSSGHPGIDLSNLPRVHAGTTHLIVCTDRFTRR
ncbi:hypothetical protein TNIN_123351 [Trichonephila inaurata madagascariensis]|uniref:Uncharacterized protein n=1 Tax=Trichonephila inaurata madagascariensis TaxID=2747483 RepID=A0A8X6IXG4_9ARAC|nr:hypothetical protein TNIN_123351 [Trichonephila inaurata madagascariensis]